MKETIKTIIEWHEQTFPDATLEGQRAKFEEELGEYEEARSMLELADMFIVACGVARFDSAWALRCFGIVSKKLRTWETLGVAGALQLTIDEKMAKNRKRVWNKTGGGTYHHENGIED